MKNFPARLKELRGESSMTEFAKQIGVSVNTYQHYEYGKRAPSLSFIEKICHELDVSSDWLLGLTDSRTGGVSVTASGGSVAAHQSTVNTSVPTPPASPAETARLLGIIESQQRIIENLSKTKK